LISLKARLSNSRFGAREILPDRVGSMSSTQTWDPERYAREARFVTDLGMPVVELLAPQRGERILDLGCGDGVLTAKLAEMGCGVVGIDASEMQVEAARKRGVDARVMAGEALQFHEEFDAVFSNAALHWMLRPDEVIAGVWRALRCGGRFVAEMGGHGNVETIRVALVDALNRRGIGGDSLVPWYFPTIEDYSARLRKAGFVISYISLFPRPTPLPGDVSSWLENFAEDFLRPLPPAERPAYIEDVREVLRPKLCDASGNWTADYVRLRFAAQKPRA
jgi:trans-aconitate methyltransferase